MANPRIKLIKQLEEKLYFLEEDNRDLLIPYKKSKLEFERKVGTTAFFSIPPELKEIRKKQQLLFLIIKKLKENDDTFVINRINNSIRKKRSTLPQDMRQFLIPLLQKAASEEDEFFVDEDKAQRASDKQDRVFEKWKTHCKTDLERLYDNISSRRDKSVKKGKREADTPDQAKWRSDILELLRDLKTDLGKKWNQTASSFHHKLKNAYDTISAADYSAHKFGMAAKGILKERISQLEGEYPFLETVNFEEKTSKTKGPSKKR